MSTFHWMGGGKTSKVGAGGKQQDQKNKQKHFFQKARELGGSAPAPRSKRPLEVLAGQNQQASMDNFAHIAYEQEQYSWDAGGAQSFAQRGYHKDCSPAASPGLTYSPSAPMESWQEAPRNATFGGFKEEHWLPDPPEEQNVVRRNAMGHRMGEFGDDEEMEEGSPVPQGWISPESRRTTRKRCDTPHPNPSLQHVQPLIGFLFCLMFEGLVIICPHHLSFPEDQPAPGRLRHWHHLPEITWHRQGAQSQE